MVALLENCVEKVLKRLGMKLAKEDIERIITSVPEAIEPVLKLMKERIEEWKEKGLDYTVGRSSMTSYSGGKGESKGSPRTMQKL
jgi:hypothetical protein